MGKTNASPTLAVPVGQGDHVIGSERPVSLW